MLTQKFLIRANECDKFGVVKLSSLVGYMIEIAGNDATQLGFGYDELNELGKYWVLSRLLIYVDKFPKWRDEIIITTWPKGIHKLFALRDFIITDLNGIEIIKATTLWLVLERINNRPNKVESVITNFDCVVNQHSIEIIPDKIIPPEKINLCYTKKVLPSDIDVNEHVNSCKYVDWLTDCFNYEKFTEIKRLSLQINFVGAAKLFDNVELNCGEFNENEIYIEAVNSESKIKYVNSIFKSGIF